MLVHLTVAFPPVVELASGDVEPPDEPPGADLGLLRPTPDEIHDLVPRMVRDPDPGQSSPGVFLGHMLSHQLRQDLVLGLDLLLQVGDPLLVGGVVSWPLRFEGRRPILEELLLPAVE